MLKTLKLALVAVALMVFPVMSASAFFALPDPGGYLDEPAPAGPACDAGSQLPALVSVAKERNVELQRFEGDDFKLYVDAVKELFGADLSENGVDAIYVIEVEVGVVDDDGQPVMGEDGKPKMVRLAVVFLFKDGCYVGGGRVAADSHHQVLDWIKAHQATS